MALLDAIRKRLSASSGAPAVNAEEEQAGIQKVLAARTGKARGTAGAPAASAIGAQTAALQAEATGRELDLAGQQAAAQLGIAETQQAAEAKLARQQTQTQLEQGMKDIASMKSEAAAGRQAGREMFDTQAASRSRQAAAGAQAAASEAVAKLATDRGITEDDIWSAFQQGNQDLALRKDSAQLEQLAFTMALADKAYIEELQQIGQLRRLEDKVAFDKEVNSMILDENTKAMIKDLDWQRLDRADAREWEEVMSKINVDAALAIATSKVQSATAGHYVSGAGQLAQAGIKSSQSSPTSTSPQETTGGGTAASTSGTNQGTAKGQTAQPLMY